MFHSIVPIALGSSAPGPHHEEDATLDVQVQATVLQVVVEPEDAAWMGLAVDQWCGFGMVFGSLGKEERQEEWSLGSRVMETNLINGVD